MKGRIIALLILILALASACNRERAHAPEMDTQAASSPAGPARWDTSYGGADKSYDTELLKLRDAIAPKFQVLSFQDAATGRSMDYNLYIPEQYDPQKSYPLVLFMADASTTGKGVKAPLMQGYGGIIWATEESQSRHPSFVLVPSFKGPENATNDNWQVSEEVGIALRLLKNIVATYSIDQKRIYTTGQSMGGMISFYLNANEPDLFAASMYVGSQWDTQVLAPLADDRFLYVVSAADPKASVGMQELGAMLSSRGVRYGEAEFAANLPLSEQNRLTQDLLDQGLPINFIRFTPGTVAPVEYQTNPKAFEHMYSFDHAYLLEPARDWLFKQSR